MGWIFRLCIMNMKRRKVRTILTVLGVTIGVISIVSLLSIGIGVKDALLGDYESSDKVRRITVYGEESGKRKDKMLTDRTIENFGGLSHVEAVYPVYEVYATIKMEQYTAYGHICGIPKERLEILELSEESEMTDCTIKPDLLFGNLMGMMFYNEKTNKLISKRITPPSKKDLNDAGFRKE